MCCCGTHEQCVSARAVSRIEHNFSRRRWAGQRKRIVVVSVMDLLLHLSVGAALRAVLPRVRNTLVEARSADAHARFDQPSVVADQLPAKFRCSQRRFIAKNGQMSCIVTLHHRCELRMAARLVLAQGNFEERQAAFDSTARLGAGRAQQWVACVSWRQRQASVRISTRGMPPCRNPPRSFVDLATAKKCCPDFKCGMERTTSVRGQDGPERRTT